MVDVGDKPVSERRAAAGCAVRVSARVLRLLRGEGGGLPKGDALAVARVAGVMAAKRAAELIPLCHPLPLQAVRVTVEPDAAAGAVRVECAVRCAARTGAEMEALTGAAVAALTVYDMCKSVGDEIVVSELRLLRKSGGKSDYPPPPPPPAPAPAPAPED